jgi:flagellar hook-basal body complex protein FliE
MDPVSIRPLSTVGAVSSVSAGAGAARVAPAAQGFSGALAQALDGVNAYQKQSEALAREFQMENPNVSLEETMIAMQKSSISFQAVVQVRNKVVQAYQDIMNMPV